MTFRHESTMKRSENSKLGITDHSEMGGVLQKQNLHGIGTPYTGWPGETSTIGNESIVIIRLPIVPPDVV